MLNFHCGAMGAGKTALLCKMYKEFKQRGEQVIVLAPRLSLRRDNTLITSRNGDTINDSLCISGDTDLYSFLSSNPTTTKILIDEAQFLSLKQVRQLKMLSETGLVIICFGLLTDSKINMWTASKELLIHADNISKIYHTNLCSNCQSKADYTVKKIKNNKKIEIGNDNYQSVCFKHTGLYI